MASRLVQLHLDCLNKLKAIPPIKDGRKSLFKYHNIWDDSQDEAILSLKQNDSYSFDFPAIFLEFIPGNCKMLGAGMSSYPEAEMRFHIFSMKLNSGKDMEQNTDVFILRDILKQTFTGFGAIGCSSFMGCDDRLDYKHLNVYKYIVSFCMNFIDTKGSYFDETSGGSWATLANPTLTVPQFQMFGVNVYLSEDESTYYINE